MTYTPLSKLYNSASIKKIVASYKRLGVYIKEAIRNQDHEGLELLLSNCKSENQCSWISDIDDIIKQALERKDYKALSLILVHFPKNGSSSHSDLGICKEGSVVLCKAIEWAVKHLDIETFRKVLEIATGNKLDLRPYTIDPDHLLQERKDFPATWLGVSYKETREKIKQMFYMLNSAKCVTGALTAEELKKLPKFLTHADLDKFLQENELPMPLTAQGENYKELTKGYAAVERPSLGSSYNSSNGVINVLLANSYSEVFTPEEVEQWYSQLLNINNKYVQELMASFVVDLSQNSGNKVVFTDDEEGSCSSGSHLNIWTRNIVVNKAQCKLLFADDKGCMPAIFIHEVGHGVMDNRYENGAQAFRFPTLKDKSFMELISDADSEDHVTKTMLRLPNNAHMSVKHFLELLAQMIDQRDLDNLLEQVQSHDDGVHGVLANVATLLGQRVIPNDYLDADDYVKATYESLPILGLFSAKTMVTQKKYEQYDGGVERDLMATYAQGIGFSECPNNVTVLNALPFDQIVKGVVSSHVPAVVKAYNLSPLDVVLIERIAEYIDRYPSQFSEQHALDHNRAALYAELIVRYPELTTLATIRGYDTTVVEQTFGKMLEFWDNHVSPVIQAQIAEYAGSVSDAECYCSADHSPQIQSPDCAVLAYVSGSHQVDSCEVWA